MTLTQARIEVDRAMASLEKRGLSKQLVESMFRDTWKITDLRDELREFYNRVYELTKQETLAIEEAKKQADITQLRRLFEGIAP